ncbi:hypothetical protein D1007_15947 [Hordeum vulgare]|nr:hypothetical protein D1007_15947 [Hordeum vulgare]
MLAKLLDMVVRHRDAGDRVRKSLCAGRPRPWHRYVSPATPPATPPAVRPRHARAVQAETNPRYSYACSGWFRDIGHHSPKLAGVLVKL